MKKIFLLIAVFLILAGGFFTEKSFAGPWTLNEGRVWTEVFTRYFHSKECFDSEYNQSDWGDGGWSSIYDVEAKIEYGVVNDLNFLLGIPYSWSHWTNDWSRTQWSEKFKHEGFKPISVGVKYKFMNKPAVAAVQLKYFIQPRGEDRVQAPELNEYGDAIEIRALVGRSWTMSKDKLIYIAGEAGYLWRADWEWTSQSIYANAIPLFIEGGYSPLHWLMWKAEVDCMISQAGTGKVKDTYTWRTGPIFNIIGKGFTSVTKGTQEEQTKDPNDLKERINLNLELQYGQTFAGRGDADDRWNQQDRVSKGQEFIAKVQLLF
ncbi:conserved hypothetical protein, secreted [Candidatus Omnitrophus magneticus]|uniref:Uncharacterized protein n=1 Tax=Candidatus Omnitrophus magneticus TaxID=1609969 RepID=A0A0F0CP06_9BACT|nr:conserved hypothetical protein, secreted [Candidatus Omnitrophus magneticus]